MIYTHIQVRLSALRQQRDWHKQQTALLQSRLAGAVAHEAGTATVTETVTAAAINSGIGARRGWRRNRAGQGRRSGEGGAQGLVRGTLCGI